MTKLKRVLAIIATFFNFFFKKIHPPKKAYTDNFPHSSSIK